MSIRLHYLELTGTEGFDLPKDEIIQVDPDWLFECLGEMAIQMAEKYPRDNNLVWTRFPLRVQNGI